VQVVLVDAEKAYLDNLSDQLRSRLPDLEIIGCQTQEDLVSELAKPEKERLIYYNQADFPELADTINRLSPAICLPIAPSMIGQPTVVKNDPLTSKNAVWRHQAVSDFVKIILHWQKTVKSKQAGITCRVGVHFLFCADPSGYCAETSKSRLEKMLKEEQHVIYLPIMPTYLMRLICSAGTGNNLSDLLMHLACSDTPAIDLGHYLQPNPLGFLQFRPPDRSDDLVVCDTGTLRRLLTQVRNYVDSGDGRRTALVDCAGLPFASLSSIAVLCDSCEIIMPDGESFAAKSARSEISRLIADLPPSTRIIGIQKSIGDDHAT